MTNKHNGNESAFPLQEPPYMVGLTKREYFAGLAMQGMITARWNERLMEADALAGLAVKHADALLLALEKSP